VGGGQRIKSSGRKKSSAELYGPTRSAPGSRVERKGCISEAGRKGE
jgi:hypothetical protein